MYVCMPPHLQLCCYNIYSLFVGTQCLKCMIIHALYIVNINMYILLQSIQVQALQYHNFTSNVVCIPMHKF